MEILIVVAIGLALWKSTSQPAPKAPPKSGDTSGSGKLPDLGSLTTAVAGGLAGILGGGTSAVAGAAATGAVTGAASAAGDTSLATIAGGATSGGASGASTGTGTAAQVAADIAANGGSSSGGTVQSGITGAGEAAGNATQTTTSSTAAASGALGTAVIFGIVGVYMVFAAVMGVAEAIHNAIKTFQRALWGTGLATNEAARLMHMYEYDLCCNALRDGGIAFSTSQVRDSRLDGLPPPGSKVSLLGFRNVITVPSFNAGRNRTAAFGGGVIQYVDPKWLAVQQSARALSLEYIKARGFYGISLARQWLGTAGFAADADLSGEPTDFAMNHSFDYMQPGLGGLNQIPLVGGATQVMRADPTSATPPIAEKIGVSTSPSYAGVPPVAVKNAQMLGILSVVMATQLDPNIYFPWNSVEYTSDLYRRMGLTPIDDRYPTVKLDGELFIFPGSAWGQPIDIAINVRACKDGAGFMLKWDNQSGMWVGL